MPSSSSRARATGSRSRRSPCAGAATEGVSVVPVGGAHGLERALLPLDAQLHGWLHNWKVRYAAAWRIDHQKGRT